MSELTAPLQVEPACDPCPSCGQPAVIVPMLDTRSGATVYEATCGHHQCHTTAAYEMREQAISAWNRSVRAVQSRRVKYAHEKPTA